MKKELFVIIFSDGERFEIMAYSLEEAKILAQADRIKHGKSYTVKSWYMAERYHPYGKWEGYCEGYCDTCSRQHVCLD